MVLPEHLANHPEPVPHVPLQMTWRTAIHKYPRGLVRFILGFLGLERTNQAVAGLIAQLKSPQAQTQRLFQPSVQLSTVYANREPS